MLLSCGNARVSVMWRLAFRGLEPMSGSRATIAALAEGGKETTTHSRRLCAPARSGCATWRLAPVGLPGARRFLHTVIGAFRRHVAFPSIGGLARDAVPSIGWSDHWAFHQFGFPSIMITDTAPYRYSHYHLPSDTPDKVDYDKLARITSGLERIVRDIAQ